MPQESLADTLPTRVCVDGEPGKAKHRQWIARCPAAQNRGYRVRCHNSIGACRGQKWSHVLVSDKHPPRETIVRSPY